MPDDPENPVDADDLGDTSQEEPEAAVSPTGDIVLSVTGTQDFSKLLSALAAQRAFQIDPKVLRNITAFQALDFSRVMPQFSFDFAKDLPSIPAITGLADIVAKWKPVEIPTDVLRTFELTQRSILSSVSIPSLYTRATNGNNQTPPAATRPRSDRLPEDFFNQHAVEVTSVQQLLKTLSTLQSKQARHWPVWRGQKDAGWAIHSSLYRRHKANVVTEDRLVEAEVEALELAHKWDMATTQSLRYLADLQHNGAPTRLLDVTADPEIATWFAVEEDPATEEKDGLVVGWGRVPALRGGVPSLPNEGIADTPTPFWHAWTSDEERQRVDWGTGTKAWTWFPPALNERMRAQRAGFLFEAGALLTDAIVAVFSEAFGQDWRESEIERATSVVGLPSRHDVLTKPNAANLVPLFVLRISATAKPSIRDYLRGKGLTTSSIYPDLPGLVSYLTGPFGPGR
ncbi:MAG: hypothetical protein JWQ39_1197 [Glaciihabitans sp.]|nr:hypothetical protein [Glaciihabitans sp.]